MHLFFQLETQGLVQPTIFSLIPGLGWEAIIIKQLYLKAWWGMFFAGSFTGMFDTCLQ